MIKTERQYKISKSRLADFEKSLKETESQSDNLELRQVMLDALQSELDILRRDIREYEDLVQQKPLILNTPIDLLPEALIKARLVKGITQEELAGLVGVHANQIQRYEATNYSTTTFGNIMSIGRALGMHFDSTKVFIQSKFSITVNSVNEKDLEIATNKLHTRKSFFSIAS